MAVGNRGFVQGVLPEAESLRETKLPPRTGMLQSRSNRLAQLTDGQSVARMHELVDPSRCVIWEAHNRDYSALDENSCADLIESFRAQGRQEVPAIVRRLRGDGDHEFEVICGARRHWTATWMRQHGFPTFAFLVEPRELSDEEAFRVADLENRSRRDLSDVERARDYAKALGRYYDDNQSRMAQKLQVSDAWLSRYLELARLPGMIVEAFGSPNVIGISHAASIAPLLRSERRRAATFAEASRLQAEQRDRRTSLQEFLPPSAVVHRLKSAGLADASRGRRASKPIDFTVRDDNGTVIARGAKTGRGGGITIFLPSAKQLDAQQQLRACEKILAHILA